MDFTCRMNCGFAEIGPEALGPDRGFTFFHTQDSDDIASGWVHLAFGSFDLDDTDQTVAVALGHEIAAAIRAQGLTVE